MRDYKTGLTSEEVAKLVDEGYENTPVENQSKTIGQIIAGNVFTYFNFIFMFFAILLILVKSYMNMAFLPIIFYNTLIGIIQEIRAKSVLDKLNVLSEPKATVVRDGKEQIINACNLVKGDTVIFEAGNQISADACVSDGEIRVNESLITGEAEEIVKREGDDLLSGSFVVSGRCYANLTNVGHNSYAAKIMLEVKKSRKKQQSEMMRSLDRLVKAIGVLIIPIGLLMFCQEYFFLDYSLKDSVVSIVAALVGMIPEGLYLLASIALVVSVMRLSKKKVVVHEMSCVETLARVDVLCVDKTGTITENAMKVNEIIPLEQYNQFEYPPIHGMINDFVSNMNNDNITMQTLKEYFDEPSDRKAIKTTGFSAKYKYSSATFEDGNYVLGAPENLLGEDFKDNSDYIEQFSKGGYRVMLFGSYEGDIDGEELTMPVIPLALILMSNPIRQDARETFNYFESQSVNIKVISGDNPITTSYIAGKAGIDNADKYIDASELSDYYAIQEAVEEYTVFGRVSPQQKQMIVKALQEKGHVVAMTGDGVNDVLALKDADCSIAMASGSEAAANAAQVVLLNSDFSCMPSVVMEGRRVVNNIQRSASLFLVKNIFSILMAAFAVIWAIKYPLVPSQLSMLGIFTIGTPGFILALQPDKNLIKGNFLTNVLLKALPAGLTDFIIVAILAGVGDRTDIPSEELATVAIMLLLTVGIVTLVRVCIPFNLIRAALCCCMVVGILLSCVLADNIFSLVPLGRGQIFWLIILMAVSVPLLLGISWIVETLRKKTQTVSANCKNKRKDHGGKSGRK